MGLCEMEKTITEEHQNMLKNGRKTNQYLILGGVDNQMTIFEFLVYLFQSFDIHFID